jgi:chloramphenicol O-acetyltransferase type A
MRKINLETWPRYEHFKVYNAFDHPHFSLTANVDLTGFYTAVKARGISINVAIIYVLARSANEITEFRNRIRGEEVVEHEVVHPSTTILTEGDLFSFCTIEYSADFPGFERIATDQIAAVLEDRVLEDEPGRDDYLFMTAIPWVAFTNLMHPLHLDPPDSVPRIAWGKFIREGDRMEMPLSLHAHHALMDGVHAGRYYQKVQEYLDQPDSYLEA